MGWAWGATEELAERGVYSAEQFNALTLQLDAVAVPATPAPSGWNELGSYVVWPTTFVHVCEWAQVIRDPVWQSIHCIQPHLLHKFQGSIHAVLIVIATVALVLAVGVPVASGKNVPAAIAASACLEVAVAVSAFAAAVAAVAVAIAAVAVSTCLVIAAIAAVVVVAGAASGLLLLLAALLLLLLPLLLLLLLPTAPRTNRKVCGGAGCPRSPSMPRSHYSERGHRQS